MLQLSTIEQNAFELLKKLQKLPLLAKSRLVGGTALALQIGHRKSVDLDFFGELDFEIQELIDNIKEFANLAILSESKNVHIISYITCQALNFSTLPPMTFLPHKTQSARACAARSRYWKTYLYTQRFEWCG
jgi:hypothetical protein